MNCDKRECVELTKENARLTRERDEALEYVKEIVRCVEAGALVFCSDKARRLLEGKKSPTDVPMEGKP